MALRIAFASDYDGTLRRGRVSGASQSDREAIRRFRAEGGLFGVDTGRTREGVLSSLGDSLEMDFAVLLSGALVLGPDQEPIEEHRIARDVLARIVRRFRWEGLGLYLVAGEQYWTTSPVAFMRRSRSMFHIVHSLDDIPDPIYGVAFRALNQRQAKHLCGHINHVLGEAVTAYQNVCSVDVVPVGCSKASGIQAVKRELGIDLMGAMGDSYNDIPMIEAADRGYTFPDAPEEVRSAADVVLQSVADALNDMIQVAAGTVA